MVGGGGDGGETVKNTETLVIGDSQWKIHENVGLSFYVAPTAVTLNNKIFVFGTFSY